MCSSLKKKENSTELQKPNIEAEVYNNSKKNVTEEKKKKELKSLISFHSVNKIDNYSRGGQKRKKRQKIQK